MTFTDPQVASVGLTERAGPRRGGATWRPSSTTSAAVAGASLLRDDYVGRAKLVVDRATDTLVGATFVGSGVAELRARGDRRRRRQGAARRCGTPCRRYPTVSEIWLRLLEALRGQRGTARDGG